MTMMPPRRLPRLPLGLVALCLALAGCATRAPQTDGAEAGPPTGLLHTPDAVPVLEPIRAGGPNKPYELFGRSYTPLAADATLDEQGLASWYGRKFHGRRTANGEVYDMYAMTAAHPTLPLPSFARVSNPANGRSIIVRVNDRGPFVKGRVIDLSYTAALKLGTLARVTPVRVERITPAQIRSGSWQPGVPVIGGDDPPAAIAAEAFWIQLGAYRERQGAEHLQRNAAAAVEGLASLLVVFDDNALYRVQAGPFATRDEAERAAERVREALLLVPLVVERR